MNIIEEKIIITKEIIKILCNNADEDGLCRITQKEIASQINRSPSCVSTTLRRLEKFDKCIEKIAPGVYKVNKTDIINNGPIYKLFEYIGALFKDPEILLKPLAEQAELANMSVDEIKMAQGYFFGAYGTPFKN